MTLYSGGADCFIDTETLTYTSAAGASQAGVKGVCKSRGKFQRWTNDGFGTDVQNFVWIIFGDTLSGGTVVNEEDTITDAGGVVYLINTVFYHKLSQQWELTCVRKQT